MAISKVLDMNNINGFYKVDTKGYGITTATFYNPETKEEFQKSIWDIDDIRIEEMAGDYYTMPIDDTVRIKWLHKHNVAVVGDKVQINRGRKFKGEIKTIVKEYTYHIDGIYNRGDVKYWVFTDGTKVQKKNCDLYLKKE